VGLADLAIRRSAWLGGDRIDITIEVEAMLRQPANTASRPAGHRPPNNPTPADIRCRPIWSAPLNAQRQHVNDG